LKKKINVRNKGASHERSIAIALRGIDKTALRNVSECQTASVDIITKLPLAIQCKALKRWSITPHNIYEQACEGSLHKDDVPVGIVKINKRQPQLAFMALDHFIMLLEKLYGKDENRSEIDQLRSWIIDDVQA
jgi:flavin reductase (DIM6/NTAB) family NADH-FMN oxidoreductase RutF